MLSTPRGYQPEDLVKISEIVGGTTVESTNADVRRVFDKIAGNYDQQIAFWERRLFKGSRQWVTSRARGEVVEIAVGTGLNLPLYPADVTVIGIELSEQMLLRARRRAAEAKLRVDLRQGDAQALDLPDACADTVVSTFTLCSIPDPAAAVREAYRILRPGGRMVLAEHGPSSNVLLRGAMRLAEPATVRFGADHLTRDPRPLLSQAGFHLDEVHREKSGVSFRVLATRRGPEPPPA
jgi:ubiquinone/menaquinone biosynthesis C-methylase UbiE